MSHHDDDDDFDIGRRVRRNVRAEVSTRVLIPAISLMVLSGLSFIGLLGFLVFLFVMLFKHPPKNQADDMLGVAFCFGGTGLLLVLKLVVAAGSVMMARMRVYPFALVAAIAQMIPISPCWILEMPFGIWALVVLLMPDTREAFYADDS